jgi:hypothetical protein
MTKKQLLNDVNLANIAFGKDGQEITLSFLSMTDGGEVATLRCSGLLVLKYQTVLFPLPLYVGEVNHEEFTNMQIAELLRGFDYSFFDQSGNTFDPHLERLHNVHIEGGEVYIQIVCKELSL